MGLYYNGKKVRNLYYNGKCLTELALGKEMTRLVEGDDFVRAQWLVGDGEAYINTTHNTNEVLEYETSVSNLTFRKCLFWFRIGGYAENKSVMIAATDNTTYKGLGVANVSSEVRLSQFESDNVVVSTDSNSIYINGIQYPCIKSDDASMIIRLFYSQYNDATSDSVKCAYFRLLSNNSIVQNLVPCRLLRPIPATLDANGIARSAGDCGMFDAVSGKFFGNVAASGAFTVEPSLVEGVDYETYDYLVVTISTTSNVVMMSLPVDSYKVSFTREWSRYNVTPHSSYFVMDGYSYFTNANYSVLIWNGSATIYESTDRFSYGGTVNINCDSQNYNFNGESAPIYGAIKTVIFDCVIDNPNVGWNGSFSTSKITVDGVDRYIPVRLLRPLPSYLDANGKARHQFECGMLDLKSMKFYGNVNTSGNFSVSDN